MSGKSVTLNRNLRAAWLVEALKLRANGVDSADATKRVDAQIAQDIQGAESRRKSLRYLRQLWLEPHPRFEKLQQEAFELYRNDPRDETARTLSFFMLLAVYPFAREVAEACGQLFRLQGTIKTEQIKRKIIAKHGEREHVLRSVRNGIAIFSGLGVLHATAEKGIYEKGNKEQCIERIASYALETLFHSMGKTQISRSDLDTHPALFAFDSHAIVASAISDPRYGLSRQSLNRGLVDLVPSNSGL
jgi:hypothetical protein